MIQVLNIQICLTISCDLFSQRAEIVLWVVQGGGKAVDDLAKQNMHFKIFTLLDRQWSQSSKPKLECSRTRCMPSIYKIFVDLVVKHIQLMKEQITFSCYKVLVVINY